MWEGIPRLGRALVFRAWPLRSLHVAGGTPMAEALRELIAAGAAPGWELHPVPGGRTALHVLAAPLFRLSGQQRFYNLLDRAGFAWAEEVAATPDACLLELRNSGPKFIAAVRQALSELGIDGASGIRRAPGRAGIRALRRRRPPCLRRWPGHCDSSPGGRLPNEGPAPSATCSPSRPASQNCRLMSPGAGTVSVR